MYTYKVYVYVHIHTHTYIYSFDKGFKKYLSLHRLIELFSTLSLWWTGALMIIFCAKLQLSDVPWNYEWDALRSPQQMSIHRLNYNCWLDLFPWPSQHSVFNLHALLHPPTLRFPDLPASLSPWFSNSLLVVN